MTLDEAIKHCKEKAKELRTEAEQLRDIGEVISSPKQPYNEPVKDCLECAEEHEQLADWLEELQYLRKVVMFMRHNNVVGLVENYLREEADNEDVF